LDTPPLSRLISPYSFDDFDRESFSNRFIMNGMCAEAVAKGEDEL